MISKLIDFVRRHHGLMISEIQAEDAVEDLADSWLVELKGSDVETGEPRTISVRAEEVR